MNKYIFATFLVFACEYQSMSAMNIHKRDLLQKEKNLFKELRDKLIELEKKLESRKCDGNPKGTVEDIGVTYTRWGKSTCPKNSTELIYSGWVGGSGFGHKGAAVDYLCMPKKPDWGKHKDGVSVYRGYVYGAEYQIYDNDIGIDKSFHDFEVPCAVCRALHTTSVLMIPGKTKCKMSWTKQYRGYLMTGNYGHEAASQYICVDEKPEKIGSSSNKDGVLLYPVEARCGSLPCGPYFEGRELTCVVCSK